MTIDIHVEVEEQIINTIEVRKIYQEICMLDIFDSTPRCAGKRRCADAAELPRKLATPPHAADGATRSPTEIQPVRNSFTSISIGLPVLCWLVAEYAGSLIWINCHATDRIEIEDWESGLEETCKRSKEEREYKARMQGYISGIRNAERQELSRPIQSRNHPKRWLGWGEVGLRSVLVRHVVNIFSDMVSHDVTPEEIPTLTPETKLSAQYPAFHTCIMTLDEADPETGPVWKKPVRVFNPERHPSPAGLIGRERYASIPPYITGASYYSEYIANSRGEDNQSYVRWIRELREYQKTYNLDPKNLRIVLYID